MRKIVSFFHLTLLTFCISLTASAQTVLYQQDFENAASGFQDYILANFDKGIPADTSWSALADSAWVIRPLDGFSTKAAVGTSDYTPQVSADDWFVTPGIRIGGASHLTWRSLSLNSARLDSYEVYISNSSQSVNGCLFNLPAVTVEEEQGSAFGMHAIDLAGLGYQNQTVYIGFHLNTLAGGDKLAIDDIMVTDDSIQSSVSLTFIVNMSEYIADSLFTPSADTVDVAGNFNNWDGTGHIMSIVPNSDSAIYSIVIPGFHEGDVLQFKFRINSSWDDTAVEFPYGGPNRLWVVANGKYTYSAYYNQEGTISDIDENIIPAVEIQVYPNPVTDLLNIRSEEYLELVRLFSLEGKLISETKSPGTSCRIDMSALTPGIYIAQFCNNAGFTTSRRIIKR